MHELKWRFRRSVLALVGIRMVEHDEPDEYRMDIYLPNWLLRVIPNAPDLMAKAFAEDARPGERVTRT